MAETINISTTKLWLRIFSDKAKTVRESLSNIDLLIVHIKDKNTDRIIKKYSYPAATGFGEIFESDNPIYDAYIIADAADLKKSSNGMLEINIYVNEEKEAAENYPNDMAEYTGSANLFNVNKPSTTDEIGKHNGN